MKTLAIIQARMGSSRLPGKVLRPILGKPMLWHLVSRVRATPAIEEVVVAVPDDAANDVLRQFCRSNGIAYSGGSESDVLDRFYRAAQEHKGDPVLRITADCPLADPQLIEQLIAMYRSGKYDYVGVAAGAGAERMRQGRFPDGLDAECFSFAALGRTWHEATDLRDREHMTRYIWNNRNVFRCGELTARHSYPNVRLTVDYPEDFELVTKIYESLYCDGKTFLLKDVMELLERNTELSQVNHYLAEQDNYRNVLED